MGILINGVWSEEDRIIEDGAYVRPSSPIRLTSLAETVSDIEQNPGRFQLMASRSCPWSHRTVILHGLKRLETHIPIHYAHGERVEGYAMDDGQQWQIPGSSTSIRHLHELYTAHDKLFIGRPTVPVLWDSWSQSIVSNESADIVLAFGKLLTPGAPAFTLRPKELAAQIDIANDIIYNGLNNAVYRAGFARSQEAYENAANRVFETLDALEHHLASSRYYFGDFLTETDVRIFPTLVRFDSIYYILFKCCRRRLVDYPNLWAYARDLYSWLPFASSVDFQAMREASYLADTSDPNPLIAIEPEADWTAKHHRSTLGGSHLVTPGGDKISGR